MLRSRKFWKGRGRKSLEGRSRCWIFYLDSATLWSSHCILAQKFVYVNGAKQARNQLGTPGGVKSFLSGDQIF